MVSKNDDPQNPEVESPLESKEQSRPPTLDDLAKLCKELNSRNAKYIIIGGMAMAQLGFVRATEDIDLLVETSISNEKAVIDAVATLPDGAARELVPGEIDQYEVVRIADEIVVDLMKKACGIDFGKAKDEIISVEINGIKIPFASEKLMTKLKQSVRPKDQTDLEFLKALQSSENQK